MFFLILVFNIHDIPVLLNFRDSPFRLFQNSPFRIFIQILYNRKVRICKRYPKAKEEVKTGAQMFLIVTIRNPVRMMLYKMPGFLEAELNRCYEKQKYKSGF